MQNGPCLMIETLLTCIFQLYETVLLFPLFNRIFLGPHYNSPAHYESRNLIPASGEYASF